jgi:hypothetical protein
MYTLIKNGTVDTYPYLLSELRRDNPSTSFPKNPSEEFLAGWDVFSVTPVERPDVDLTKNVAEGTPELIDGQWTQVWEITDATPEEIAERKERQLEQIKRERANAYRNEADPLFFKYQRGEGSEQEWLDKVQEIRERFPYPELNA